MTENYFLSMIETLRKQEDVILHDHFLNITDLEKESVDTYLKTEYQAESLNYPHQTPIYHSKASIWGAQVIYITAQLLLCRKKENQELQALFPKASFEINASTILSVDLCLRFLPLLINELHRINNEDPLLDILDQIMYTWHYSGINYDLNINKINLQPVIETPCLQQLYINRVIEYKNMDLAMHPQLHPWIKGNLGLHSSEYWKTFNIVTTDA